MSDAPTPPPPPPPAAPMVSEETKKALQAEVVAVKTRWGDAVKMKKAKDGPQAPLPIAVSRTIQKPASAEVYDVEEITVWLWIDTLAPYDGAEKAPIRVEVSAEIPAHVCNVAAEHVCKRWRAELTARGAAKGWMLEKILGWCESTYTELLVLDPRYVDCYMGINEHGMTIRRYAIQEPPPPEPEPDDDDDDSDYDSDDSDDEGVDDIDSKVKKMGLAEEEERQMRIKLKAEAEADRQYREQRRKEAEEIREQGADGGEKKQLSKKEKEEAKQKKQGQRMRREGSKRNKFDAEAAGKKANKKNGLLH